MYQEKAFFIDGIEQAVICKKKPIVILRPSISEEKLNQSN